MDESSDTQILADSDNLDPLRTEPQVHSPVGFSDKY